MLQREYIVKRIKSLPEESLEEVVDFIEFLESKRKRLSIVKEDPLSKTIGICEGPSDLAEKHDKYVYG
ncbi:MAG: DUF2281 domain-containing protein [Euryarchaeota archaeon]|nr:DUF2281 domain-containing protein [Euryarchaeota archaeon]